MKLSKAIFLFLAVASDAANLRGQSSDALAEDSLLKHSTTLVMPYQDTFRIGKGINVINGGLKYDVFDSYDLKLKPIQSQDTVYLSTSSSQEMKETTKKVAEASGGAFGVTVSGSLKWITESDSSSTAVNLIANTNVEAYIESIDNRSISGVDKTLLSDLSRFLDNNNLQGFIDKYGTHYISGMKYGGSANSRISIKFNSESTKNKFAGELSAAFKSIGYSSSAKYKEELSKVTSRSDTTHEVTAYVKGAFIPELTSMDIDEVLVGFKKFGEAVYNGDDNPYPLSVECSQWETIKEVRDILGDTKLLPDVDIRVIPAITNEYNGLKWALSAVETLEKSDVWDKTPSHIQESKNIQIGEYYVSILTDMKHIEDSSFSDLAVLDPITPEYRERYGTNGHSSIYQARIDELFGRNLQVNWSFEKGQDVEYAGPSNGRVTVEGYMVRPLSGLGLIFKALYEGTPIETMSGFHRRGDPWALYANVTLRGDNFDWVDSLPITRRGENSTVKFGDSSLSVSFI
jgi:hypothetical protein